MSFSDLSHWASHISFAIYIATGLWASIHAMIFKRDPRSTVLWFFLIWFSPFFGAAFYYLFGINRIQRKALRLRGIPTPPSVPVPSNAQDTFPLEGFGAELCRLPLLGGNRVALLENGEGAYPEMLQAIRSARHSISVLSYIFNLDETGKEFALALADAQKRGVHVRVLVDDMGSRQSYPRIFTLFKELGVRAVPFLPLFSFGTSQFLNLRNHRKILIVDGRIAFTGGMNICAEHRIESCDRPVRDSHFKVEGPVVNQIQRAFIEDWAFATKEVLDGENWFPKLEPRGDVLARVVLDGPAEHLERIKWLIQGALATAHREVRIQTPYFIPDSSLMSALNTAALRGIRVRILLPAVTDQPWVNWATRAMLWQILEWGCEVSFRPGPFDHSKLMVQDHAWILFGSSNLDPRSFRLNFELNVECFDPALAQTLAERFDRFWEESHPVTLKELESRPFLERLRDGAVRMFAPYL